MPNFRINLLPPKTFSKLSLSRKAIAWLSKSGKIIIITTQVVVVTTLVSRFVLDRKVQNLDRSIQTKLQLISIIEEDEEALRQFQHRMKIVSGLLKNKRDLTPALEAITSLTPEKVVLRKIEAIVSPTQYISLNATTPNQIEFATLISLLKKESLFETINLTSVGFDNSQNLYTFSLEIPIVATI